MEYVLRVRNVMDGINEEPEKRSDFVAAMGNIMEQTAKQAHIINAMDKYRLEDQESIPEIVWTSNEVIADDASGQDDEAESDTSATARRRR